MPTISLRDGELARQNITHDQEIEISKMYKRVYRDLQKQLKNIPGDTSSESIKRTYLKGLTKQLDEAYKSLGEGLEKQIKKGAQDASQAVVSNMEDWLQKAGLNIEGAYSHVPKDIVAVLSTGQLYGSDWTLSKAIWWESKKHSDDIHKIVATGVAANRSAYDIAKDLEKYVNPSAKKEWDWSKVYPGTSKKVDYNAQRLARTMVSHAYQQSLLATTKYNPFVTGYKWRSAHTHRTCEICNERDGQVYTADTLPLDHPNGMCTFLTELSGSLDDIADRLGDWVNGKEDPGIDKWYNSMVGNPLDHKVPSKEKSQSVQQEAQKNTTPVKREFRQITKDHQDFSDNLMKLMYGDGSSISKDQLKANSDYTGDSYKAFNSLSLGKYKAGGTSLTKGQVKKEVETLTKFIESSRLPEDLILYRGAPVSHFAKNYSQLEKMVGSDISVNQFLSTSLDRDIAQGFVDAGSRGKDPMVMVEIRAPQGSKAIPSTSINKFSTGYGWLNEAEILFAPGQSYRMVDFSKEKGLLTLEVIP